MEAVINYIVQTPPAKLAERGVEAFKQINYNAMADALAALDVEKHTAGIVLLLSAQAIVFERDRDIGRAQSCQDEWSNRVTALLPLLDTQQLPYVATDLKHVSQMYTDIMIHKKPIAGIRTFRTLIKKYAPGPTFITPQHAMFVQLCIAASNYKAALSIITSLPFELDPDRTAVDGKDVRLFLYYAGIAWIGNNQMDEAIETLRACVQVPAQGCSLIVIEAYKKFILASLIHRGHAEQLSKGFIPSIQRHAKHYAPYDDLIAVYSSQNLENLYRAIMVCKEIFVKDHNWGLAKQLVGGLQKHIVKSLTKTFLTLSLSDIASRIKIDSIEEAEQYILTCIKRGEIQASVSQKDGMVSFHSAASSTDPNTTRDELDSRLQYMLNLSKIIGDADYAMATDTKYLEKVIAMDRTSGASVSTRGMEMMP